MQLAANTPYTQLIITVSALSCRLLFDLTALAKENKSGTQFSLPRQFLKWLSGGYMTVVKNGTSAQFGTLGSNITAANEIRQAESRDKHWAIVLAGGRGA